jgi:hypothetical protein
MNYKSNEWLVLEYVRHERPQSDAEAHAGLALPREK